MRGYASCITHRFPLVASSGGFTLMEIMLVVMIIGILATIVVANLGGMSTEAKITRAQADIATFRTQLGIFEQRYGHYPTEEEGGLMALVERPSTISEADWKGRLIENDPTDPWGVPYVYLVESRRIDKTRNFNLYSMGPNKQDDQMTGDDVK
jgi:general secretion pathway protein G